jgi:uncharacterized lipoprotein YmbA
MTSACVSPNAHLYVLNDLTPDEADSIGSQSTVLVGPISLPGQIDRPQLVVREGAYQVSISELERWAVPLKEALPELLARRLTTDSGHRRFVAMTSAAIVAPEARVSVDFTSFDVSRSDGARISAHWVYRSIVANATTEGDGFAHADVTGTGYEGLIDALRRASLALADKIASKLPTG